MEKPRFSASSDEFEDESLKINKSSTSSERVHVVHEPTRTGLKSCDVIAVGGNTLWHKTWIYGVDHGIDFSIRNWLKDGLSTVLPSSRIIVYQCDDMHRDLGKRDANGMIQDLIENRRACDRTQTPIIFLGMMLGGSFIKQLVVSALRSHQAVVCEFGRCIRGIVFFGTPQNAQPESPMQRSICPPLLMLGLACFMSDVRRMRSINKVVPLINREFEALRPDDLRCVCFYDTANVLEPETNKDLGAPLVGRSTATFESGIGENIPLHTDFSRLLKFKSLDDPNLVAVLDALNVLHDRALQSVAGQVTSIVNSENNPGDSSTIG